MSANRMSWVHWTAVAILAAVPVMVFAVIAVAFPDEVRDLFDSPWGHAFLGVALLVVLGAFFQLGLYLIATRNRREDVAVLMSTLGSIAPVLMCTLPALSLIVLLPLALDLDLPLGHSSMSASVYPSHLGVDEELEFLTVEELAAIARGTRTDGGEVEARVGETGGHGALQDAFQQAPQRLVLVPSSDVFAGDELDEDSFASRRFPAALVTPQMIPAGDFKALLGKSMRVPLAPGEPFLRSELAGEASEVVATCAATGDPETAEPPDEDAVQDPAEPWEPVDALVVTRDMAAGETLEGAALARRWVPRQYATAGVVRAAEAKHVVGATVALPLDKDGLLRWTHLSSALPPDTCRVWRSQGERWLGDDGELEADAGGG